MAGEAEKKALEKEMAVMDAAYKELIIAYSGLVNKQIKSRAPEARAAAQKMTISGKSMRALIQAYKSKI